MGKSEKTGLGRALVKHHNQMVQQSKEKGHFYRSQHRKVLESYTEISDIDAILEAIPDHDEDEDDDPLRPSSAAAAASASASASPNLPIKLDASPTDGLTPEEARKLREMEEKAHRGSLRVPRRPPWHAGMSVEELDANERQAFLAWRRVLAGLEENDNLILTSFEKNLDIWRQLWRVLERSDLLVMVVDARDPLFYRCPDLEEYAREIDEHKRTLLLVNKADLLPFSIRRKWAEYFNQNDILYLFWSAKAVTAALEGKKLSTTMEDQDASQMIDDLDTKIYGREELLARLQWEAEQIVIKKTDSINFGANDSQFLGGNSSSSARKHVVVGFVGYPNVGKSSTINALVGQKRTGVTSTPGKTKHFQTLIISEELTLCDCPGLVFPSFSSSRYEMMASGVLPIDRMTQNREAVQVVANRVPRHVIESVYNISLPKPKPYELQSRPPLAAELLRAYCASRGYVASSGLPDETRAARLILKDYIDGKLPHYEMPPPIFGREEIVEDVAGPSLAEPQDSDSYDPEVLKERGNEDAPALVDVLDNLSSFDMENGLASKKEAAVRKQNSSYKQHKKPQRKKDRSWRTGNDGGDGTPVVRVFQKPVNTGPLKN